MLAPPWPNGDLGQGLSITAGASLIVTLGLLQGTASEVRIQLNAPGQDYGSTEEDIVKLKRFPLVELGKKDLVLIAPLTPNRYSVYLCVVDGQGRWARTGTRRFLDVQP